jgi:alpha-L-fucosidase
MKWWDDGRLGMFLHWGVYSTFGGEYNGRDYGKEMGNASAEWIYLKSGMPREDYEKAALSWNPYKYRPEEWARMARDAGMKYMVLTAKHHDGYALFDSKVSDWNVVDHSAIKRDLVEEYIDACRKYDIKVGFYYSHEKDWTHHARQNQDRGPLSEEFIEFSKNQITELLTNYGKIDIIWYDTPRTEHEEFNKMCAGLIRKYQPDCIINGRIGNNLGDYKNIGDRAIVNPGEEGYMESIMTMRLNWGFDRNDDFWKPSEELIKMVSKSACRGSNFLLNIGPTPEGTLPVEDQVRLHDLGEWMKLNGEAIYKTSGNPFGEEHFWGSISVSKYQPVIYAHLWNWIGGDVEVKGIISKVLRASFLDNGADIKIESNRKNAVLKLELPDDNITGQLRVIKMELDSMAFDLEHGPDYIPPPVHHVTHRKIVGTVTKIEGINFTVEGKIMISANGNEEILEEKETSMQFTLNDHVRFRTNFGGNIHRVQGYDLEIGQKCHVVYSPFEERQEVEIITFTNE